MADFDQALEVLMHFEGSKYTDDSDDPGGPTRYGITVPFLQEYFDTFDPIETARIEDIRNMTLGLSRTIYRTLLWDEFTYGAIVAQEPATAVLLASVNLGYPRAHRALQWALKSTGKIVLIDGILGTITIAAVNEADSGQLAAALRSEVAGIYRKIVQEYPYKRKFLVGLLRRAYWPN